MLVSEWFLLHYYNPSANLEYLIKGLLIRSGLSKKFSLTWEKMEITELNRILSQWSKPSTSLILKGNLRILHREMKFTRFEQNMALNM